MPSASASVASRANGFSTPPSANGHGGRKGPLPHIDDLTSVAVDLNPHAPLRKFLEVGDKHMRQAITYNDFRRPDLALQEFITAFTIAVDKIPKHKDYPSLKTDRGDLSRLYNALKSNITSHCATFDKIKDDIKEDNKRSGVQPRHGSDSSALSTLPSVPSSVPSHSRNNSYSVPSHSRNSSSSVSSHTRNNSINGYQYGGSAQSRLATDQQSVPGGKEKPAVQPKPHALHGNAIRPSVKPGSQDLLNRFARLRDPQVPSGGSPTSAPFAEAGADQRQLSKIDSALPSMPKLPDAIYSPARGTVTSETANLPSSTPRGMFSRTNSINSVPSSARNSIDISARPTIGEVFIPAHSLGDGTPLASSTVKSHISQDETITPEELKNYMSQGSSAIRLMLIDVRSREEYDEGHIFAQTSICIEPSVLARGEVSASEIEDSLGIAPDEEMHAFESRAQYDLVVFYDQSSSCIPKRRPSDHPEEMALYTLYQALVHFDYPIKLRRPPKLLAGGIDGWVDLFGSQSLKESKTNTAAQQLKPRLLQASKTGVKTLAAEEIKTWKEAAARNQVDYITSTNDFLRRYPAIGEHQESMSSDYNGDTSYDRQRRHKAFENELPPAPPARPAPALPRTSYSGVSTRKPDSDVVFAKSARAVSPNSNKPTGLVNSGNKCYAASLIQCLLASPGFAAEFAHKDWPANWAPGSEKDPQLMARILGNLIQWLCGRQFTSLKPTTILNYSRSRHSGYPASSNRIVRFGDDNQHDSSEYLNFIFQELGSETNRVRGTPASDNYLQPGEAYKNNQQAVPSTADLIKESWEGWSAGNQSILDQHWGLGTLNSTTCTFPGCGDSTQEFQWRNYLDVSFRDPDQDGKSDGSVGLDRLLTDELINQDLVHSHGGFDCGPRGSDVDEDEKHKDKQPVCHIIRLPRLLCIRLKREFTTQNGVSGKSLRRVEFEVEDLDLQGYVSPEFNKITGVNDDGFSEQPTYELYGVISHQGAQLNRGHYISYVRHGPDQSWFCCNDDIVTAKTITELKRTWYTCQGGFTPMMLFYKRKDVDWEYAQAPEGMQ